MSRWIDADALAKEIKQDIADEGLTERFVFYRINEAPSIDIVRCRECKHWDDRRKDAWWSEEGACYLTSRLGHATYRNHDDFCSRGERNSSEKPNKSEIPTGSERSSE